MGSIVKANAVRKFDLCLGMTICAKRRATSHVQIFFIKLYACAYIPTSVMRPAFAARPTLPWKLPVPNRESIFLV